MQDDEKRDQLLRAFKFNRVLAHKYLFAHRHKDADPAFHADMLALLYDTHPQVALMAFRGAAKSTYIEEYTLLGALFQEFIFGLVVGPKEESAAERLAPMRQELETNELIIDLFGDQKSSPWSQTELVLANGVKIQAMGAGQSMRGKKHNDERPDLAVIDDLEDEDSVRTEESRHKTDRWLMGTLRPALHPTKRKIRFLGTAIHPKALIFLKCKDPKWKSKTFPAITLDLETGEEKSAWPARFPIENLQELRTEYLNSGNMIEWQQEYQCVSEDIAGKPFQPRMIKVEPAPSTLLPVECFIDPARTVKARSARTGYAAWSWMGNSLIVHEAEGHFHKPDEIIGKAREWDTRFKPVHIGVEADGLEEFLMQPFRTEMQRNGSMPIVAEHAPKDKNRFIEGLQPFYTSGTVIHVKHLPDLETELLQFPTGRIDVPNALAYALKMRAGRPVYEDFTFKHIAPILEPHAKLPRYLLVSSRPAMTGGVLVQYVDGVLKIYHDWVYNEPPQECFERMLREAILIGGQVKVAAPREQFDQYTNNGLPAAIKQQYITAMRTNAAEKCEGCLRDWLRKQIRSEPAILVCQEARWVVNGLSRGYARKLDKGGRLSDYPIDNQYRLIMEAIESWVSWFDANNSMDDLKNDFRYDHTSDGRKFITLRAPK